jgi:hypothetical protein
MAGVVRNAADKAADKAACGLVCDAKVRGNRSSEDKTSKVPGLIRPRNGRAPQVRPSVHDLCGFATGKTAFFTAKLELPVAILPEAQSGGGFRLFFSFHARLGERGAPVEFSGLFVPF